TTYRFQQILLHILYFRSPSENFSRESPPQSLPPRSPRLVKRPSTSPMPSRSGSTTPLSLRKKIVAPTDYQDTVPGEFEEKVRQTKSVTQGSTQDSQPQTPLSEYSRKEFTLRPSPKLTRVSSKVFEKVRGLEERRRSLDIPEGSISGGSWAGFNRAGSVDSDDGGSRLGISRESSREDLREALKEDAAERRSMFRHRAASLEDKPRYSQKVQDIENKFTEELQRIKKLVDSPSRNVAELTLRKVERRPPSPLVQRVSRLQESPHIQESLLQTSQKDETSGRKTSIEVALRKNRPESPLVQKRVVIVQDMPPQPPSKPPRMSPITPTEERMEKDLFKPASNIRIPAIIVEDEKMDEDVHVKTSEPQPITGSAKEGRQLKTKGKNRRPRPMSPELDSSDDSYVSAGEDPMEAPVFEFPLQDTVAAAGADVVLKCIIAGTPIPEGTMLLEGERHTLLIKSAGISDGGKYCVTAVNQEGKASSCATLIVKAGTEYLSISAPLEESMDFGGPELRRTIDTRFRKAPAFLVSLDQAVIEGQEVTMSVRISGQPKPMLYWLRDRVTVKTGPRHAVREAEDGAFEMTVKSAVRSDSGVYTCKIINEYGTKQCEGKLEVKGTLLFKCTGVR
uniref:Ig-like domain-containing protein n=1 Tax=Cyclopterus lumpus TaxID=8103 RepID=A0A8C3A7E3_CYCLU